MHIGPSDHVPWLNDRKWAYIRMEGRNFGDVPLNLELKLEVWDSPNSAGVIIDAVRCAKLALDRGIGGPLLGPSAYFMKSPPVQYHDDVAHEMVESFAAGEPGPGLARRTDGSRQPSPAGRAAPAAAPTSVEPPAGLLLAEGALVEAQLEQEGERLAHGPARRRSPSWSMTWVPSRSGRMASSSSCSRSSAMRASSSSIRRPSARALPALRVVQSQRVSSLSRSRSGPGVAHVAAHRPVGPPQPVGVEAEVQLDQLGTTVVHVVAG